MLKTWLTRIIDAATRRDQYPTQKLSFLGKSGNSVMIFPHGYYSNVPNDVLCVTTSVGAGDSTETKITLGQIVSDRPDIEQGESILYHLMQETQIKLANNGNLEIICAADVTVDAQGDVTVTSAGSVSITASGDIDLTATGDVNITGSTINLN